VEPAFCLVAKEYVLLYTGDSSRCQVKKGSGGSQVYKLDQFSLALLAKNNKKLFDMRRAAQTTPV
jgi:hypothetical protein